MDSMFEVTAAAVICEDEKFLLVEEFSAGKRVLNQPAGHVEPGETIEAAVVREVREETGYHFVPRSIIGIYSLELPDRRYLRVTFAGDATPPTDVPQLDEGIIATHWMSRADLAVRPHQLRSGMVLASIDDFLAGRRFELSLLNRINHDHHAIVDLARSA